ncbi:MAG: leucine-rich repeat protein [Ruminococcus sp.]
MMLFSQKKIFRILLSVFTAVLLCLCPYLQPFCATAATLAEIPTVTIKQPDGITLPNTAGTISVIVSEHPVQVTITKKTLEGTFTYYDAILAPQEGTTATEYVFAVDSCEYKTTQTDDSSNPSGSGNTSVLYYKSPFSEATYLSGYRVTIRSTDAASELYQGGVVVLDPDFEGITNTIYRYSISFAEGMQNTEIRSDISTSVTGDNAEAEVSIEFPWNPVLGDTNIDGILTIADCVVLQSYLLANTSFSKAAYTYADYNGDHKVDGMDLAAMRTRLLLDYGENMIVDGGSCGENATWSVTKLPNGNDSDALALTISGEGEMTDYRIGGSPWYDYYESIQKITVSPDITEISEYAFYGMNQTVSVEIPSSVTTIGRGAFLYCSSLESISIPDSVTSIGSAAFEWCDHLKSIVLPKDITEISSLTFACCESLEQITIPYNVTSIGDSVFSYCSSLSTIYYEGTESMWNTISIGTDNDELSDCKIYYNIS